MNNETHCDYFNRALKGEEHSEDDATLLNEVVDSRLVVAVVVVVHSEEERVQEDKEYDEVIEPAKLGELTRSSYLHSISHTVAFLSHICPRNKKSDRLSYCRLRPRGAYSDLLAVEAKDRITFSVFNCFDFLFFQEYGTYTLQ